MQALTRAFGSFKDEASLKSSDAPLESTVFLNSKAHNVGATNLGEGVLLNSGRYANPVIVPLKKRVPALGVVTIESGGDYFATANTIATMPDVTGFTGGERFTIVAAKGIVGSTLTVDGTQSEEIEPANGDPTDTVFDLTTVGVSFEFIFNAVTGNWEV